MLLGHMLHKLHFLASSKCKGFGDFGKKGCFVVFNMTQDTGRIRELKNNTAICDYTEQNK